MSWDPAEELSSLRATLAYEPVRLFIEIAFGVEDQAPHWYVNSAIKELAKHGYKIELVCPDESIMYPESAPKQTARHTTPKANGAGPGKVQPRSVCDSVPTPSVPSRD